MLTNGQDKLFARDAFVAPNNEGVVDEEGENVDLFETLPLRQRERETKNPSTVVVAVLQRRWGREKGLCIFLLLRMRISNNKRQRRRIGK